MAPKPAGATSDGSSNKRKLGNGNQSAPARSDTFLQKRAKVHAARAVPSQPANAALKDGELDLQAFVAAHDFEIRSLQQSMANSKAVSSTRAFQQVPRGLRRRTASHNPKRVPRRLRARAKKEMAEDNTPVVEFRRRKPTTTKARLRAETAKRLRRLVARAKKRKLEQRAAKMGNDTSSPEEVQVAIPRPKIRRNQINDVPRPVAKFRRRQLNKTWLPTHLWHAKRARMTAPKSPLWRFALPLTPNEKVYRPVHRAQRQKGTVVWDTSYMSTIGIHGTSSSIATVFSQIGVPTSATITPQERRWKNGTRAWTGLLTKKEKGGDRTLCPCTIVWDLPTSKAAELNDPKQTQRHAFLRLHPSAFLEVFNILVSLIKSVKPRPYIEDLRFEIGSIELTGPASTEALLSVISPYEKGTESSNAHGILFQSLTGVTNPSSLPNNAVLAFSARDPRLQYPPQRLDYPEDPNHENKLAQIIGTWPSESHPPCQQLFDRDARHKASLLPSQKAIDRRRSKRQDPSKDLKSSPADPPIPLLLIAERGHASHQSNTQGTWTVMLPWKCVLPFWRSIVHCPLGSGGNPRFGGLNEAMQVAFERSVPWFPADFIGTNAGLQWELERRAIRHKDWSKRPKSKRVEWESLGLGAGRKGEIGDGLACDFEHLLGLPKATSTSPDKLNTASDDTPATLDEPDHSSATSPLRVLKNAPKGSVEHYAKSSSLKPDRYHVVNVRISILSRGVVTNCARIYRLPRTKESTTTDITAGVPSTIRPGAHTTSDLPSDLRQQWLAQVPAESKTDNCYKRERKPTSMDDRMRRLAQELTQPPSACPDPGSNSTSINGHHPLVPDEEDLIGFVTSGSFCLTNGHGAAMGTISLEKIIADVRENASEAKLCIVRNAGENVGWIAKWQEV